MITPKSQSPAILYPAKVLNL